MKIAISILVLISIATGALYFWSSRKNPMESDLPTAETATPPSAEPAKPPARSAKPIVAPPGVSEKFVSFINIEAPLLDAPSIDEAAAKERIAAAAATMGEAEINLARDIVLNSENSANQRILSNFLLGSAGKKSREARRKIVPNPVGESGRAAPHSIDELKNTQAKALSLMALDSLIEEAATDREAREDLVRLAGELKDESQKNYLQQKLRELPQL